MTTPAPQPADGHGIEMAPEDAAQRRPEGFAISPAVAGLPAIYVPQSTTQATPLPEMQ